MILLRVTSFAKVEAISKTFEMVAIQPGSGQLKKISCILDEKGKLVLSVSSPRTPGPREELQPEVLVHS